MGVKTRERILRLLEEAEHEVALFQKNEAFVHFSRACEKPWLAFNLLIEIKSRKKVTKKLTLKKLAIESGYRELFALCHLLHILHFKGYPDLCFEEEFENIREVISEIRRELEAEP